MKVPIYIGGGTGYVEVDLPDAPAAVLAGDAIGPTGATEVVGLLTHALPALSGSGALTWNGAAWVLAASGGALTAILQNRVQTLQTTNNIGVAARGNFAPPATLTMVASGKLRVTVNAGFQTNGTITPIVVALVDGGMPAVKWSFQQVAGTVSVAFDGNISTTFEFDSAATIGQTVQIYFTSSSGDGTFSSFVLGLGDACASILLEELP